jgi:protein transport protein SEC13
VLCHLEGAVSWAELQVKDCPSGVLGVSWAPCEAAVRGADGAPAGALLAAAGCDGKARVHSLRRAGAAWAAEGEPELLFEGAAAPGVAWLRDVAWRPSALGEEPVLAAGGEDQVVTLWAKGARWGAKVHLPRFPSPVWRLSWNTTGSLLAVSCGDNTVTLWKEEVDGTWVQVSNVPLDRS